MSHILIRCLKINFDFDELILHKGNTKMLFYGIERFAFRRGQFGVSNFPRFQFFLFLRAL